MSQKMNAISPRYEINVNSGKRFYHIIFFDLSDNNVIHIFVRMQSIDGENIKKPIISHAKNLTNF